MSAGAVTETAQPAVRFADLVELTKPRITVMVMVTAAAGALMAAGGMPPLLLLLNTLAGTGLLAAGASALNQVLERETDARMRRTADRPLPAGRLSPDLALVFGVALCLGGIALLALTVNFLTALLGAVTAVAYLFVYTPLKRVTSLATVVGAVPGAIPPMMGWAAVADDLALGAWALFGILFCWQLPHFLAIAWIYRGDYERGGFPMLPVLDPAGRATAGQMLLWCAALVPVSLLPGVLGLAGGAYFAGALLLGAAYLAPCITFARQRGNGAARRLLLVSVAYLPGLLGVMLLDNLLR